MRGLEGNQVLLGVTGSVAAYKACYLARALLQAGAEVSTVLTASARKFLQPLTFQALTGQPCYTDDALFEPRNTALHIELAARHQAIVIAPATANTIARLASGIADNLLTATVLAFTGPVVVAPAMHAQMWQNDLFVRALGVLREHRRFRVLETDTGPLAGGDIGPGRMAEGEAIVREVQAAMLPQDLAGTRVLVTGGPTREHIDPVRVLTNPSTGSMGIELAWAAHARGAEVTLILGPTLLEPPRPMAGPPLRVHEVESAADMAEAVLASVQPSLDVLLMAAAVADHAPASPWPTKVPKSRLADELALVKSPDILEQVARSPDRPKVVIGFAAETDGPEAHAREKLAHKGCDAVYVNPVGPHRGFGPGETTGTLLFADGSRLELGTLSKQEAAHRILDATVQLLAGHEDRP